MGVAITTDIISVLLPALERFIELHPVTLAPYLIQKITEVPSGHINPSCPVIPTRIHPFDIGKVINGDGWLIVNTSRSHTIIHFPKVWFTLESV